MMKRALWLRISIAALSALVVLTALIFALHTKAGRPLLARLGVGCPIQASPESIEAARSESARVQRGSEVAASRPALGFVLGQMTLTEVKAWAERAHVECGLVRAGLLRCRNVPRAALGGRGAEVNRLDLGFLLGSERLVNISAWRSGLSGPVAAAELDAVVARLEQQVGAPTREAGRRSAEYLAAGPLHTALVEYRFRDYIADVSATNIPGRGLMMREHYMSVHD